MVSRDGPTAQFSTRDLKKGRVDNICKFIISSLFSSHRLFDNKATVVLYGPPKPPVSVTFTPEIRRVSPTEKDVAEFLSKALGGKEYPGIHVERAGIEKWVEGAAVLHEDGEDISKSDHEKFILGDHLGFPEFVWERVKHLPKFSVSPHPHTAWAVVSFLNIYRERNLRELEK